MWKNIQEKVPFVIVLKILEYHNWTFNQSGKLNNFFSTTPSYLPMYRLEASGSVTIYRLGGVKYELGKSKSFQIPDKKDREIILSQKEHLQFLFGYFTKDSFRKIFLVVRRLQLLIEVAGVVVDQNLSVFRHMRGFVPIKARLLSISIPLFETLTNINLNFNDIPMNLDSLLIKNSCIRTCKSLSSFPIEKMNNLRNLELAVSLPVWSPENYDDTIENEKFCKMLSTKLLNFCGSLKIDVYPVYWKRNCETLNGKFNFRSLSGRILLDGRSNILLGKNFENSFVHTIKVNEVNDLFLLNLHETCPNLKIFCCKGYSNRCNEHSILFLIDKNKNLQMLEFHIYNNDFWRTHKVKQVENHCITTLNVTSNIFVKSEFICSLRQGLKALKRISIRKDSELSNQLRLLDEDGWIELFKKRIDVVLVDDLPISENPIHFVVKTLPHFVRKLIIKPLFNETRIKVDIIKIFLENPQYLEVFSRIYFQENGISIRKNFDFFLCCIHRWKIDIKYMYDYTTDWKIYYNHRMYYESFKWIEKGENIGNDRNLKANYVESLKILEEKPKDGVACVYVPRKLRHPIEFSDLFRCRLFSKNPRFCEEFFIVHSTKTAISGESFEIFYSPKIIMGVESTRTNRGNVYPSEYPVLRFTILEGKCLEIEMMGDEREYPYDFHQQIELILNNNFNIMKKEKKNLFFLIFVLAGGLVVSGKNVDVHSIRKCFSSMKITKIKEDYNLQF